VVSQRLGIHGLRPFGSNKVINKLERKGQGSRINKVALENDKKSPLKKTFLKVKAWIDKERSFKHEIRRRHILQRLKYEMEFERDQQLIFLDHNDPAYRPWYLKALQKRLVHFQIHQETKAQRWWLDSRAIPTMGAAPRLSGRKSERSTLSDNEKFQLTAAGVDYMVWLVAKGSIQDFELHVADPEDFIKNRESTYFVLLDETAVWLKCKGDEATYVSAREVLQAAKRAQVKASLRSANENVVKQEIQEDFKAWCQENLVSPDDRDIVCQWYQSGGDKHRLTIINISEIGGWWGFEAPITYGKKIYVLLVFSEHHVRAEDIDDDHRYNKRIVIATNEGDVVYEQGQHTKSLYAYIEWRKESQENRDLMNTELRVWGQHSAWVDTQMNIFLAELLQEIYGQCVLVSDCLLSRWAKPALVGFYRHQVIIIPYAPDSGTYLQEPDTHEHAGIKASIRFIKCETQFDLEQEAKQKNPTLHDPRVKSGPRDYLHIVTKGMLRFKSRNPLVPIQGVIQNNILACRPTRAEDGTISIKLIEECPEKCIQDILVLPGIARYPPSKGLAESWCQFRDAKVKAWPDNKPTLPDWDKFTDVPILHADDLPELPDPDVDVVIDCPELEHLQLTDHQKVMSLPVDMRIQGTLYPASVHSRVKRERQPRKLRKNKWASKFSGQFAGTASPFLKKGN